MKSLDQTFETLKSYVSRISWVFAILETVLGLTVGALLGAHLSGTSYIVSLCALGFTYLVLICVKFSTQRLFPSALVEELQAKDLLADARKQISRRDVISGFVTHSITALNSQTCAITSEANNALCAQAVSGGLSQVIEPLISRPQYIFDCNESEYSVACLVSYRAPAPTGWTQEFICLRDDHELAPLLSTELLSDHKVKGHVLDLQKAIQRCYNDNAFVCESFSPKGVPLAIIASPIPQVCETSEANGILMFVTRCGHRCPADVENTFRIFGRIIANWLAKYSECVSSKEDGNTRREQESGEQSTTRHELG